MRVSADVDVWDMFALLSNEDLLAELERRGSAKALRLNAAEQDEIDDVRAHAHEALDQLIEGRADDARLTLERTLYPKWNSVEASAAEFIKTAQVAA